jgi:hypothetical protein
MTLGGFLLVCRTKLGEVVIIGDHHWVKLLCCVGSCLLVVHIGWSSFMFDIGWDCDFCHTTLGEVLFLGVQHWA